MRAALKVALAPLFRRDADHRRAMSTIRANEG
jgi:hypothetical protein